MVCDGVLDHTQKLIVRIGRPNRQTVKQLNHETGESLEGSGNSDGGRDFDENALGGVDINLEFSSLVDGGIKERQEALDKNMSAC